MADKVNVVAVMLVLIIREPLPRASLKTRVMRMTRPAVDNFVKNFFLALDFEYSGMVHCTEIHTLKINILNKINGLRVSFSKSFEKCTETTQLAVLVEYSAASRMVLRFKTPLKPSKNHAPRIAALFLLHTLSLLSQVFGARESL